MENIENQDDVINESADGVQDNRNADTEESVCEVKDLIDSEETSVNKENSKESEDSGNAEVLKETEETDDHEPEENAQSDNETVQEYEENVQNGKEIKLRVYDYANEQDFTLTFTSIKSAGDFIETVISNGLNYYFYDSTLCSTLCQLLRNNKEEMSENDEEDEEMTTRHAGTDFSGTPVKDDSDEILENEDDTDDMAEQVGEENEDDEEISESEISENSDDSENCEDDFDILDRSDKNRLIDWNDDKQEAFHYIQDEWNEKNVKENKKDRKNKKKGFNKDWIKKLKDVKLTREDIFYIIVIIMLILSIILNIRLIVHLKNYEGTSVSGSSGVTNYSYQISSDLTEVIAAA